MWTQLHSGTAFLLSDPKSSVDTLPVSDILISLARQARYRGHTKWVYTVGQHIVLLVDYAVTNGLPITTQKQLFWHDAEEAILGDIITPVKKLFPAISEYGDDLRGHILARFGLERTLPPVVHELDQRILLNERKALCDNIQTLPWNLSYDSPLEDVVIEPWTEEETLSRLWAHLHRLHPLDEWVASLPPQYQNEALPLLQVASQKLCGEDETHPEEGGSRLRSSITRQVWGENKHQQTQQIHHLMNQEDELLRVVGRIYLEAYRRAPYNFKCV